MNFKKLFGTVLFLIIMCTSFWAQSDNSDKTPAPYTQEEFSQPLLDLRRFEIITFGSMPFVTMDAAIVYNGYKYFTKKTDKFNPLATADYKPEEMKKIIITSVCISAGIGLTDYIVRLVKRKNLQKKNSQENNGITITDDPDAVKIPLPEQNQSPVEE